MEASDLVIFFGFSVVAFSFTWFYMLLITEVLCPVGRKLINYISKLINKLKKKGDDDRP